VDPLDRRPPPVHPVHPVYGDYPDSRPAGTVFVSGLGRVDISPKNDLTI